MIQPVASYSDNVSTGFVTSVFRLAQRTHVSLYVLCPLANAVNKCTYSVSLMTVEWRFKGRFSINDL